jgi:hypothetical protein
MDCAKRGSAADAMAGFHGVGVATAFAEENALKLTRIPLQLQRGLTSKAYQKD